MTQISKEVMKDACKISLQTELQKLIELDRNQIVYQSLSKEQVHKLAHRINFLPFEYRNLLFFRYYFENTILEISKILEIEDTESKLLYIQKMLSRLIELNSAWIDHDSMKEACSLALHKDIKVYENIEVLHKPMYSNSFRRKLKEIRAAQKPYEMFKLIVKRVAVFVAVCILSLSAVLAVNAKAREKFYHWIVETFPNFSIFITQNEDEYNSLAEMSELKINYIPKGFNQIATTENRTMVIYNYLSKDNKKMTIKFFNTDNEGKTYYDTENIELEEFIFKESQAYTWKTDKMTYLIWHQDGIECHITGNLSKDEIIKVAENIVK